MARAQSYTTKWNTIVCNRAHPFQRSFRSILQQAPNCLGQLISIGHQAGADGSSFSCKVTRPRQRPLERKGAIACEIIQAIGAWIGSGRRAKVRHASLKGRMLSARCTSRRKDFQHRLRALRLTLLLGSGVIRLVIDDCGYKGSPDTLAWFHARRMIFIIGKVKIYGVLAVIFSQLSKRWLSNQMLCRP
ncbi:hypothetical protein [Novosphingobium sp.]|uniref:hypothetical protein n=1 Tax=Novosphingobium sp. TaxID=1874826 RepID=UPI0031DBD1C4